MRRFIIAFIGLWLVLVAGHLAHERARAGTWGLLGVGIGTTGARIFSGQGDISGARYWGGLWAYTSANIGTNAVRVCNASDVACANIVTSADGLVDMASIVGGTLNCGGAGGQCTVHTVYDQTGNLLCAGGTACDLVNATAATRPLLILNCGGLGAGKPCMRFSSASTTRLTSSNFTTQAQPYTMGGIAKRTANFTTSQILFAHTGSPGFATLAYADAVNSMVLYAGAGSAAFTVSDSAWHSVLALFDGNASNATVDGVTSSTLDPDLHAAYDQIVFGWNGVATHLDGDVVSIGLWAGTPNRAGLTSNGAAFWGY